MVILAAIGRFFKKIWNWIKETAWIQPLLIVGIIFGIIFSIPSIVKAAKSGKAEAAKNEKYYHNFQISLELKDSNDPASSPADKFTTSLEKVVLGANPESAVAEFKQTCKDLKLDVGNKFFVSYVATSCEKCKEAKPGFELFEEKLNKGDKYFETDDKEKFGMVTIFADEETSYTTEDETAFVKYLGRHSSFFEAVGSDAYNTAYYSNGGLSDSDLEALETADPIDFLTPTILLVELGNPENPEWTIAAPGVTEVMFGVTGDDENAKATTLLDCWRHEGQFTINEKAD